MSRKLDDPVAVRISARALRIIGAVTVITILALWALVTGLGLVKPVFLPSPWTILTTFKTLQLEGYANSSLAQHTLISLMRVSIAFVAATALAIPTGIVMALHDPFRGVMDPIIEFYRPLPPLAYLPLIVIWLGIGEVAKVTLIFLAVFAPICLSARAGVRSVSREKILVAGTLGATRWQIIRHIILPGALPEILTGMRVGIGFGWTTLVAAEMVAATAGLGFMVVNARKFLRTDTVIAGIFVIGVIAYGFDLFMRFVERKLVPWKGKV